MSSAGPSTADFEALLAGGGPRPALVLRLYVAGSSFRSIRAIQNAKEICDEHFAGRYSLEVIDIFQQPGRARADEVIAVPVLIRKQPTPVRRLLGDLSDHARVVTALEATGT